MFSFNFLTRLFHCVIQTRPLPVEYNEHQVMYIVGNVIDHISLLSGSDLLGSWTESVF